MLFTPGNIRIHTTTAKAAASSHPRTLVPESASGEMRPIHQQAAQRPNSRPRVGTNKGVSRKVKMNTTVPSRTKPMICLNVSIQAPGLGRKRSNCGKTPISR